MNTESTNHRSPPRNSIVSTLLNNQQKKLQNEVESLIAGVDMANTTTRKSTTTPAATPPNGSKPSQTSNGGIQSSGTPNSSKPTAKQSLLQTALEKRRIRPIPATPPAAASANIELADDRATRKPATAPKPDKKVQLPEEKRWWVQNGQKAVLLNAEQMAAAYSQGLLRVPSVRVREEHGTEWHPITRFLHEFSWEAELGHPDAPPTAAQLQAWKRLGQR